MLTALGGMGDVCRALRQCGESLSAEREQLLRNLEVAHVVATDLCHDFRLMEHDGFTRDTRFL